MSAAGPLLRAAAARLGAAAGSQIVASSCSSAAACSTSGRSSLAVVFSSSSRSWFSSSGGSSSSSKSWHTGAADSWQAWAQQRQPLQQHLLQQQQQQQRRAFGAWSRSGQRWRPETSGCGSATAISSSSGTSGTSSGIVGSRLAAATAISSSSGSAAAPAAHHQLQQARGLLGRAGSKPKRVNHQDHNKRRPKRTKIKTRSVLKHRVIVDKDGVMWRTQAARRHKRVKKSRGRLSELKGLAPLSAGWARRLRKLGYDRRWWHVKKA